ncbi:Ribosome maturation protein SBDS [Galdieria sulphuraria]|uniref:Transcription factor isoform 1 n=1 Tax=Galdieria sulphuraria TaxID=130081 RepID=M2WTF4_GALSU|nr:transcription factor isoform 1 [Galdieria sulphuraria]EME27180.1 transcription factor isoform 1 [Galdieria sulphuraria]GJD09335.1 Ribosome maturation protein SBDS [Galdieria sulphuraria]|eukprot:XP_005703700.1 transcription factor isoform 1 [Galdieria sulphuraria]
MLKQPVTQVRLTNVVVVRLKKHGKRFEIACYRNKVLSWRNGTEKDLDEVLQVENVFSNVSKGVVANKKDLLEAFQTTDIRKICVEILNKGELQVSDKERNTVYESLVHEIATIVANKCIDVETNRPLTVSRAEKEMKNIHFSVVPKKSAKQQALEVIRKLEEKGHIRRASMRIKIQAPLKYAEELKQRMKNCIIHVESEEREGNFRTVVLIDPGSYREIDNILKEETNRDGFFEVLSLAAIEEGEKRLD